MVVLGAAAADGGFLQCFLVVAEPLPLPDRILGQHQQPGLYQVEADDLVHLRVLRLLMVPTKEEHRPTRRGHPVRYVEVGRHRCSGPRLEDHLLDAKPLFLEGSRDSGIQRSIPRWKATHPREKHRARPSLASH